MVTSYPLDNVRAHWTAAKTAEVPTEAKGGCILFQSTRGDISRGFGDPGAKLNNQTPDTRTFNNTPLYNRASDDELGAMAPHFFVQFAFLTLVKRFS